MISSMVFSGCVQFSTSSQRRTLPDSAGGFPLIGRVCPVGWISRDPSVSETIACSLIPAKPTLFRFSPSSSFLKSKCIGFTTRTRAICSSMSIWGSEPYRPLSVRNNPGSSSFHVQPLRRISRKAKSSSTGSILFPGSPQEASARIPSAIQVFICETPMQ